MSRAAAPAAVAAAAAAAAGWRRRGSLVVCTAAQCRVFGPTFQRAHWHSALGTAVRQQPSEERAQTGPTATLRTNVRVYSR